MQRAELDNGFTEVYAWGADRHGQLGLGSKQVGRCYCIPRLCSFNVIIKTIACGEEHSGFITSSGQIFTMGSNNDGRLGIGDKLIKQSSTPCLVETLAKYKTISLSCGWGHNAAIVEGGDLYTWGVGEYGALGHDKLDTLWSPMKVFFQDYAKIASVSCGTRHTALIDDLGQLRMCGSGDAGQLGTGSRDKEKVPIIIKSIERAISVSAGILHTLVINRNGVILAMGGNSFGQLGIGNKKPSLSPVHVKALDSEIIVKISAGHHSAALNSKGELFLWGTGTFGELLVPTKFVLKDKIKDISVGGCFGIASNNEGAIYSWGSNSSGELGVGDYDSREKPTLIPSLAGKPVLNMCCGGFYAMALGKSIRKTKTPIKPIADLNPPLSEKTIEKSSEKAKKEIIDDGKKIEDNYQSLYEKEKLLRTRLESEILLLTDKMGSLSKGNENQELMELKVKLSEKDKELYDLNQKMKELEELCKQEDSVGRDKDMEIESCKMSIATLTDEINNLHLANQSSDQELIKLKEINCNLQKDNANLLDKKTGDNKKLKDLLKDNEAKIKAEIEDKHKISNEKTAQINKLLNTMKHMESQLKEKDALFESSNKAHTSSLKKFEESFANVEAEKQGLRKSINELNKDNQILSNELESKEDQIKEKEMVLSNLNSELQSTISALKEKESMYNAANKEKEELKEISNQMKTTIAQLREDNKQMEVNSIKEKNLHKQQIEELTSSQIALNDQLNTLKDNQIQEQKKLSDLQTLYNDKAYENEELIRTVSVKQNEVDTMAKEIDAWKQMVDRIGKEEDELRKIIESLETKNKNLGEIINTQIYKRANECKQKVINTLQNSQSPMRIQQLLSSGKKLNYTQPSHIRLENIIKEDNNKKSKEGGEKEINKMIPFQNHAQNVNPNASLNSDTKQEPEMDAENQDKAVNSNYDVVQTLEKHENPKGLVKLTPTEIEEENKEEMQKSYETPLRDEPADDKIKKSAQKLMSLLGIASPIRQEIAKECLNANNNPPLASSQSPPNDYSFRESGGTVITQNLVKSNLENMKRQLSTEQENKNTLEKELLKYEETI